jgi:4-amino-4-deoxy-L-arabinose transferase-like glycosyltransferase
VSASRLRRLFPLFAAAAVIAYGAVVIPDASRGVGGSDSAGYTVTARDIVQGRIVIPLAVLDRLGLPERFEPAFVPLAHVEGPLPATIVPYYPPGFPLQVAFAALVAGWDAGPHLVSPIAAILCVVLTFVLGRQLGLSRPYACAGAAMLGGCTVFLLCATQVLSDVSATLWALVAVCSALRARRSDAWALAAGAAFGMGVLVRPTSALLILPLACALPWRPRALLFFGAGGLPFAAFAAAWNRTAFGSPFRTGYSHQLGGEFAWTHFGLRLRRYGLWILAQCTPLVPLGWLGVAADRNIPRRDRALLLLWFGSLFALYCFWGPSDSWTYTRYFLPAAPAFIVGFLLCLRDIAARWPRAWQRTATVAIVLAVIFLVERRVERRHRPLRHGAREAVYPEACRALAARAGAGPALVASMDFSAAIRLYTDLTPLRWDLVTPADFAIIRERAAARGERIFALLKPYEVPDAVSRVPGDWKFLGNVREAGLWELGP